MCKFREVVRKDGNLYQCTYTLPLVNHERGTPPNTTRIRTICVGRRFESTTSRLTPTRHDDGDCPRWIAAVLHSGPFAIRHAGGLEKFGVPLARAPPSTLERAGVQSTGCRYRYVLCAAAIRLSRRGWFPQRVCGCGGCRQITIPPTPLVPSCQVAHCAVVGACSFDN
jgi:hypothetical protein